VLVLLMLLAILVLLASIHWLAAAAFLGMMGVAYVAIEATKAVGRAVADSAADAIGNTIDRYHQRHPHESSDDDDIRGDDKSLDDDAIWDDDDIWDDDETWDDDWDEDERQTR